MTLTVTPSIPFLDQPAVLLDVSSSPAVTDVVWLSRIHPDGSAHRVLTTDYPSKLIGGTWTGYDFHAPFNVACTYIAQTASQVSAASVETWLASDDATWLIHPSDPELSVLVDVVTNISDTSFKDRSQRFQVLGKRDSVTRTDYPRGGESGSMSVMCDGAEAWSKLKALFADSGPILVNLKPLRGFVKEWKWIQPGDLTMSSPAGHDKIDVRIATFSYEETEQPDADAFPLWSFDDITALGKTFTELAAYYPDFRAMQLDLHV